MSVFQIFIFIPIKHLDTGVSEVKTQRVFRNSINWRFKRAGSPKSRILPQSLHNFVSSVPRPERRASSKTPSSKTLSENSYSPVTVQSPVPVDPSPGPRLVPFLVTLPSGRHQFGQRFPGVGNVVPRTLRGLSFPLDDVKHSSHHTVFGRTLKACSVLCPALFQRDLSSRPSKVWHETKIHGENI